MLTLALALAVAGDLPKEVREAFEKAESFELYSLNPAVEAKTGFHGSLVLGKLTLKGDDAKAVREAIEKGAKDSDGRVAKCFVPRHGIRVGEIDLVICFQCLQAHVHQGEKMTDSFPTTSAPAAVLNKFLAAAGIPLPEQPRKK